jgi:hypothetical protein
MSRGHRPLTHAAVAAAMTLLLLAGGAAAHKITAPMAIVAGGDGSFAYEVTVTQTAATEYGSTTIDGTDNTDIGMWHADGFCVHLRDPGDYVFTVTGKLLNPRAKGTVSYTEDLCDGWSDTVTTTIDSPPVKITDRTWGALKGVYR